VTVVEQFLTAVNRKDVAAATARFATGASYHGNPPCSTTACTTPAEIAGRIDHDWVIYAPITYDLEQTAPTTVVFRGQGFPNRLNDTYVEAQLTVAAGQITALVTTGSARPCRQSPRPAACQASPTAPAATAMVAPPTGQSFVLVLPPDPTLVGTPGATTVADPLTVVRQYGEAINRGDAQAAGALWAEDGSLQAGEGFACAQGCRGRAAIQVSLTTNWFPYLPTTEVLLQTSPTTVVMRGQGSGDRAAGVYHEVTYEVSGGLIQQSEAGSFTTCALAPVASICPGYTPPPPVPAFQLNTATPAPLAVVPSVIAPVPAQPARPTPQHSNGIATGLVVGGVALLTLVVAALVVAAVGLLIRRAARSHPRT
jgi:limonene-1,2-epoxide hydrolase